MNNDASWTAQERGPYRLLIVEDEPLMRSIIVQLARSEGYEVTEAPAAAVALHIFEKEKIDLAILDLNLTSGGSGLDLLRKMRELDPEVMGIIVTAYASVESAVEALHQGAYDYITKPFANDHLKKVMRNALEGKALFRENRFLRQELREKYRFESIIGKSDAIESVFRVMEKVARTDTSVLITGESGTGKELVARAIHYNSLRRDKAFVPVDCNSLSENLLESELFGHVKGSFTGAVANKKGMFEVAGSGTLFLDEIGNFSMGIQGKLLRVLQEREYRAVGDTRTQTANFRLITATNKDLKAMVAAGTFRDDLFYRINIFPIHVPALRERRDDIPALAYHFLKVFSAELGKKVTDISEGAMSALVNYGWPGNVRELENAMHRAVILTNDNVVRQAHLVNIIDPSQPQADLAAPRTGDELKRVKKAAREKSVEEIEKQFVIEALKRNGWNVTRSAEETGMQRANFQALMKKYAIRVRDIEHDAGGAEVPNVS
ncbi:sigma-54-dependent transcriptional regulator [Candidatus Binatus sp.]|uniref:sigma-54-dependent transcriptional regulator n=1 Tax=Candidatus Binatus sp. TaxID=2811406 RepID=UPI003F9CC262